MRQPQRGQRVQGQQTSIVRSYAAPVGGWNARDALASMHPADAVTLKNFYPGGTYVEFRGGHALYASSLGGTGKTLMVYSRLDGTSQMFCTTTTDILDVSSPGSAVSVMTARTNAKLQWTMFGDGSSQWLIACNGVDKPAYYDGTTWTAVDSGTSPALTGVTSTTIISAHVFKGRLLFLFNNSLKFGYLPSGVAGGAVSTFDLSGEASKGGYLIAFAHWTRDGGSGADDYAVFFTSEGEALVYRGTNPSSATTWAKVGTFTIGKPIGRRCVIQYGADCVVMTEEGIFPMSALLVSAEVDRAKISFSDKIRTAFTSAARSYKGNFGWKVVVFPAHNAILVNVPFAEDGTHEQYVMNTLTKAWCEFTNWDAEDLAVYNGELYFCKGTAVYKAWTGTNDNLSNIVFYGKQAFQDFGDSEQKHCQLFMPILAVDGNVAYAADVDVDFHDADIVGTVNYTSTSGSLWDTTNWDAGYWSSSTEVVRQWSSPTAWQGHWISTKIKITSNSLTSQWMGSTVIYNHGSGI